MDVRTFVCKYVRMNMLMILHVDEYYSIHIHIYTHWPASYNVGVTAMCAVRFTVVKVVRVVPPVPQ